MRNLKYELSNGKIVLTMAEAKNSGLTYKEILEEDRKVNNKFSVSRKKLFKDLRK